MYKGDVLDIMGSPQYSTYKNGEYIWTYRFLEEDRQILKEVKIKDEFVTAIQEVGHTGVGKAEVRTGMNKSQVLDSLGFPLKALQKKGEDIWIYKDEHNKEYQVNFTDGKVSNVAPVSITKEEEKENTATPTGEFEPVE